MVALTWKPSTERQRQEDRVQGYPQLHMKLEVSLGYKTVSLIHMKIGQIWVLCRCKVLSKGRGTP